MKRKPVSVDKRLQTLRETFDGAFAAAVERPPVFESFITVRLGKRGYAVPLRDIGGMFVRKPVTRLPTPQPALLGLAHFRGITAPVYDLSLLLGHATTENPTWLAIADEAQVAFAFERFDGHARVTGEDILTEEEGEQGEPPRQSIRINGKLLPVVHLPSIIGTIEKMAAAA